MHIKPKNPRLVKKKINTVAFRKKIKIKDPSEKNNMLTIVRLENI